MFDLIWKGEVVDSFSTREEAEKMKVEYDMAYGGGVTIVKSDDDGTWSEFAEEGLREDFDDDFEENDNWDMDGDALASAGFGTDEDYGYYGDGEW
jgi:hypothetical protein|tara:strand:- start:6180 stop:6464 length:285 start_codon:yes stop_codon:yes gene_type:complete